MLPKIDELQSQLDFKSNYFILAFTFTKKDLIIYHICSYEIEPNQEQIDYLDYELRTDNDFKLDDEIMEHIEYKVLTKEEYTELCQLLDESDDWSEI